LVRSPPEGRCGSNYIIIHNTEDNPTQDVVGSSVNLYFNFSLLLNFKLSERPDLSLSTGMTHFSNGRTYTPQKGINTLGLAIGLKYNINPIKNYTKAVDPDYKPTIRPTFIVSDYRQFV
jgi:hypothetical protein